MADAPTRAERAAALEEKRRRLEDLKKRRVRRGEDTAKVKAAHGGTGAGNNLDEYIDGLLATEQPEGSKTVSAASSKDDEADATAAASGAATTPDRAAAASDDGKSAHSAAAASGGGYNNVIAESAPASPPRKAVVETFTIGTQTEVDDFPEPPEPEDDDEEEEDEENEQDAKQKKRASSADADRRQDGKPSAAAAAVSRDDEKDPKLLSTEEVEKEVGSEPFSSFINTASKKVERMLGTPLLGDLLVDYAGGDGADSSAKGDSAKDSDDSRFLTSRQAFECPTWTTGRDVTDIDWSPLHRELFLSTYTVQSATSASSGANATPVKTKSASSSASAGTSAAVSVVAPHDTMSSSLTPRSGELQSDGLLLIWNLTMPTRPEHIFTCGSPVTVGRFHPTESPLLVGGCESGQLVVWDVRAGRLPVQKSALLSGSTKGHVYPVDGMEMIEGGVRCELRNECHPVRTVRQKYFGAFLTALPFVSIISLDGFGNQLG